jgi:hypothetical protein
MALKDVPKRVRCYFEFFCVCKCLKHTPFKYFVKTDPGQRTGWLSKITKRRKIANLAYLVIISTFWPFWACGFTKMALKDVPKRVRCYFEFFWGFTCLEHTPFKYFVKTDPGQRTGWLSKITKRRKIPKLVYLVIISTFWPFWVCGFTKMALKDVLKRVRC